MQVTCGTLGLNTATVKMKGPDGILRISTGTGTGTRCRQMHALETCDCSAISLSCWPFTKSFNLKAGSAFPRRLRMSMNMHMSIDTARCCRPRRRRVQGSGRAGGCASRAGGLLHQQVSRLCSNPCLGSAAVHQKNGAAKLCCITHLVHQQHLRVLCVQRDGRHRGSGHHARQHSANGIALTAGRRQKRSGKAHAETAHCQGFLLRWPTAFVNTRFLQHALHFNVQGRTYQRTFSGTASSEDVVVASARAYVGALNKLIGCVPD